VTDSQTDEQTDGRAIAYSVLSICCRALKIRNTDDVSREQLLPESLPWLIANHKLEKAESIVRRVFKIYHARLSTALSVRRQVRRYRFSF